MTVTRRQLARMAEQAGERFGWDFSQVRWRRDPVPWAYGDVARRLLSPADHVLDVGTGGGETFLKLSAHFGSGVGIDVSPAMIARAKANLAEAAIPTIRLSVMDAHHLDFQDETFDIVLNRHCIIDVGETVCVLRRGGRFFTQQVGRRNTETILQAFGWTPDSFPNGWWQPLQSIADTFSSAGHHVEAIAEYDVRYWFADILSLVFWLKAVPLPEPFDPHRHVNAVNRILDRHTTANGIETNEHREMLIVRKA